MELELKDNFDNTIERLEAWWNCEIIDRACVQIVVKKSNENKFNKYKKEENQSEKLNSENNLDSRQKRLKNKWMDVEFQVEKNAKLLEEQLYFGEAFPYYMPNLGPDLWSTLYGTELQFGKNTSWAEHHIDSWEKFNSKPANFEPNFNNQYWNTIEEMMEFSLELGKNKYITALPDLHPGGDLLTALRGPEKLCLDLAMNQDLIKEINNKLIDFYPKIYNKIYSLIKEYNLGSVTWVPFYHRAKAYVVSCDLSALISPAMFKEVFLPGIKKQVNFLDKSLYHLDGPDSLRHLDTLLEIEELDGIQWLYGAGNGPSTKWIDVFKKIQESGKCNHIYVDTVKEIELILDELKPHGLLFTLKNKDLSKKEAEKAIKMVEKKSK